MLNSRFRKFCCSRCRKIGEKNPGLKTTCISYLVLFLVSGHFKNITEYFRLIAIVRGPTVGTYKCFYRLQLKGPRNIAFASPFQRLSRAAAKRDSNGSSHCTQQNSQFFSKETLPHQFFMVYRSGSGDREPQLLSHARPPLQFFSFVVCMHFAATTPDLFFFIPSNLVPKDEWSEPFFVIFQN